MTEIKQITGALTGKKYKSGMNFEFFLAIPCVEAENFALLIEHDTQNNANRLL